MDAALAEIADAYMRWVADGDPSIKHLCSPEFRDNVSGMGVNVFDIVSGWFAASFSDRSIEHHTTMTDGERLIIWFTFHGVHVGNGFPRMVDLKVDGAAVAWPQVHILRVENGKVHEHWAVRDDLAMLDSTRRPKPD
jgi:predicted ester cyclase